MLSKNEKCSWQAKGDTEGQGSGWGSPSYAVLAARQLRQRFELEIVRMKQMHQKDREDQEEELEDVRQSCQKRVCEPQIHLCPGALFLKVRGMQGLGTGSSWNHLRP